MRVCPHPAPKVTAESREAGPDLWEPTKKAFCVSLHLHSPLGLVPTTVNNIIITCCCVRRNVEIFIISPSLLLPLNKNVNDFSHMCTRAKRSQIERRTHLTGDVAGGENSLHTLLDWWWIFLCIFDLCQMRENIYKYNFPKNAPPHHIHAIHSKRILSFEKKKNTFLGLQQRPPRPQKCKDPPHPGITKRALSVFPMGTHLACVW